ncbi:MAG: Nif3-like dinuclear metal center hexameric protein [Gemmatimonadaceae bacterium]|nr:Nif3-like dinuclear metal center hexameric protein [Gemmatimonadaceae bacterium]
MPAARDLADWLDALLDVPGFPDYPAALNGLQLDHRGPVHCIATAVDFSQRTIDATIATGANFLVLHHGMFWGGAQRIVGPAWQRLSALVRHDVAVYAVHLPLDAHPDLGNCALLAREFALEPSATFHEYQGRAIGASGVTDVETRILLEHAQRFASAHGGMARATPFPDGARTKRWAVLTGAGADSNTLHDAARRGIDTLIVGEGPHHTTVDASELGLVVIYAGHYATETLGVQAIAAALEARFGIHAEFLSLPTGS